MTARHWCFTIFGDNESADELQFRVGTALSLAEIQKDIQYAVFQIEQCPETHRIHAQGYIQLGKQPARMGTIKRILLTNDAHLEAARGSAKENVEYCSKQESRLLEPIEYGTFIPGSGFRSDLLSVAIAIREGSSMHDIAQEYPETFIRYSQGILRFASHFTKPRHLSFSPTVFVLWGPSGVGKSWTARWYCEWMGLGYYNRDPESRWWDGYVGQQAIIFDDYSGELPYRELLRILDQYEFIAWIKGGSEQLLAHTFIFTSNNNPLSWYQNEDIAPLVRRITGSYYLNKLDIE